MCLAVSFKYRNVDQEIPFADAAAYIQLFTCAVNCAALFFLHVNKRNPVLAGECVVSAIFKGLLCLITYPGAFRYNNIIPAFLLQILDDSGNDLRMGRSSEKCR